MSSKTILNVVGLTNVQPPTGLGFKYVTEVFQNKKALFQGLRVNDGVRTHDLQNHNLAF